MKQLSEVFGDILKPCPCCESGKIIETDRIIEIVAKFQKVTVEQMKSQSRYKPQKLVVARMLAAYLMLYLKLSSHMVGRVLGRDHSSIAHYKRLFEYDILFKGTLDRFRLFMAKPKVKDGVVIEGILIPYYENWRESLIESGRIKSSVGLKKK